MTLSDYTKALACSGMVALLSSFNGGLAGSDGGLTAPDNDLTRGIGIYPGAPSENFAPTMVADNAYRNIALHRTVHTSSDYDYNHTGQLLTDGIATTALPHLLTVTTNEGPLPRRERESAIDGGDFSRNILMGDDAFLQYDWNGSFIQACKVRLVCRVAYDEALLDGKGYELRILSRTDQHGKTGKKWRVVASESGTSLPGKPLHYKVHSDPNKVTDESTLPARTIDTTFDLDRLTSFDNLRVELRMKGAAYWTVTNVRLLRADGTEETGVLSSRGFTSAWRSDGGGPQWACIDLGRKATFDRIRLHWVEKAAQGHLEVSDDGQSWTTLGQLPGGKKSLDDIALTATQGRYLRLVMEQPGKSGHYTLSEIEVMGSGGLVAKPHAVAGLEANRYSLDGGGWMLQRASEVEATGEQVSTEGFKTDGWIVATVPGTVLTSYVNIGALPNPNFGDNLLCASESFFNANFWYRTEFTVPSCFASRRVTLNLDGINWKANVYLNGHKVSRIEGAFMRGQTDVTAFLKPGANVLAVEVEKPAHPGAVKEKIYQAPGFNGGLLGMDNPTFHASVGWDWISTIRGRETGIWNDVYLSAHDAVSLRDPLVSTRLALPDTTATMTPAVVVRNHEGHAVSGTLRGHIGDITFEQPLTLSPSEEREVSFSPDEFPALRDRRMNLWWPNGYGTPYLYDAGFEFVQDGTPSDRIDFKAGIRQVDCKDVATRLTMYVNGRRFVPLGGNWGFSEHNLNYRGREYDTAVRLHRDMNFNMIRNWVGQVGDEEFYEACDRHGIMVWQDFWLANPADGPDPADEPMFVKNAYDFTARMRRHPSIAIYCGRNEGYPPATLDRQLRDCVARLNPGFCYISSSADDGVSGHGPYNALPAKDYFDRQTGQLHTERGMPNVMTYDGLARTFAPADLWPQGDVYGQHDYCLTGAQKAASFNASIEKAFGKVESARQFGELAQWVNYDGYRAMYESGSRDRMGLLIWMSHACWPSLTWQCYDYYFEPTAAFFGCKKACEPLHIQRNASTGDVEVVNRCAGRHEHMRAVVEILDLGGNCIVHSEDTLSCADDTTAVLKGLGIAPTISHGASKAYFERLKLYDKDGAVVSENFYVLSSDEGNLQELNDLPKVSLTATTRREGERLVTTLRNDTKTPAMMVRLNLKAPDGDQVLPVSYSDNFFHLMPGEEKTVTTTWKAEDARRQSPQVELTGFNVVQQTLK